MHSLNLTEGLHIAEFCCLQGRAENLDLCLGRAAPTDPVIDCTRVSQPQVDPKKSSERLRRDPFALSQKTAQKMQRPGGTFLPSFCFSKSQSNGLARSRRHIDSGIGIPQGTESHLCFHASAGLIQRDVQFISQECASATAILNQRQEQVLSSNV